MLPSISPYDLDSFFVSTKVLCTACLSQPLSKKLTHQKKHMADPPPAPLRPTRYAKRRRVEPVEASEPELEAVAVQIACETALLCHETVTGACLDATFVETKKKSRS